MKDEILQLSIRHDALIVLVRYNKKESAGLSPVSVVYFTDSTIISPLSDGSFVE
jgi:hypothetical protein